MRKRVVVALVLAAVMAAMGTVTADDVLTYQGNKARLTVGTIKPKADGCSHGDASAIGEMLSTALLNTGRFIVLANQEEVGELAAEIDMAQSGYVEEGRGPEKGLMEGADLLVTGAVTTFEPNAGGGGGGLGGITKKAFGKVGVKTKKGKIAMELKLIDIRTRRILTSKTVKAESKNWKVNMAGGGWVEDVAMAGDLGAYENEPMGDAIRAVLADAVQLVTKKVPDEYYRYQGDGQYTQEYAPAPAAGSGSGDQSAPAAPQMSDAATPAAAPAAEDMTLYTRYDFVPGDKVIYYDDMSEDEVAEFPWRWSLDRGVFEVVELGGEKWILCTDDGSVRPKIPKGPLPEQYTVEMEFYDNGPDQSGNYFYIYWVDAQGKDIGSFGKYGKNQTWLEMQGKTLADKRLSEQLTKGVHTLRIMATKRSMKCYVDEERVANVPHVEGFNPVEFRVRLRPRSDPNDPTLFRGFRFAEGGKSMREQLEETGRIVTHGILFDPGSFVIKGESYKTLKSIGDLLTKDPQLRLSIEGHTDSDGDDASNKTLSENRARAVRDYLMATFAIGAGRLEFKGHGELSPIDTNETAEGKANNRRVELLKI